MCNMLEYGKRKDMRSEVYNIDCMEYMRTLPDKTFQLAIADPPYGIGADKPARKPCMVKQRNGTYLRSPRNDYARKDWDAAIPTQSFFDELIRVSERQIIWGANYFGLIGGMIVWDKLNGDSDQFGCEIAWKSFDIRTDIVHYMWQGMFQGEVCSTDINKAIRQQGNKALNEKRIHPTQKPTLLYAWLLNQYASIGDTIFDPMMGSQSCRVAAYKLGLDFVGCELDKDYFVAGCERFDNECKGEYILPNGRRYRQLNLFE